MEDSAHITPVTPEPDKERDIFDSMTQLAGAKGISVDLIRRSKNLGCPAFRTDKRISWAILQPWLVEHAEELQAVDDDNKSAWILRKLKAETRREEFKEQSEKGAFLPKAEVAQQLIALGTSTKAVLKDTLENELPPKLVGLSEIQARELLTKACDKICKLIQEGLG